MNRPDKSELIRLLSITDKKEIEALHRYAYEVKSANVGKIVYFRGIVEVSNICTKNCYYCGIRRDNGNVMRYLMERQEIIDACIWAHGQGYGSVVLQSGERQDKSFTELITGILREVGQKTNGELGFTLSLGEQSRETYQQWFDTGAHRYLLRIETSNPALYRQIHPDDHNFSIRLDCLRTLRSIGYQTGTGVMIGLPYQEISHLADDILFFWDEDMDMIGMGPFIPHQDTPFAHALPDYDQESALEMALKMIAVCRITLPDINIAATTALQALNPTGREMGLLAGANIIMPNITDVKYRSAYQLYNGKPCLDENASLCRNCLENRISSIGETIGYNQWGDSRHFSVRSIK